VTALEPRKVSRQRLAQVTVEPAARILAQGATAGFTGNAVAARDGLARNS
jgi:hypothetical protein